MGGEAGHTYTLLILRLGHATGGERVNRYEHVEACGRGLLRRGLNFSTAWSRPTTWVNSVEKDWKHVLMHNVVTLNTCCDIACLTYQLPHITTGSFQSHRRQSTTGSFHSFQRLKERNKPSVEWKSFAVHKLVWWHFQVGWASGLQFVFLWDNESNQKYVSIILLKMSCFGFTRRGGQSLRFLCHISQDITRQKLLKSVNFWQSYSKNKRWTF